MRLTNTVRVDPIDATSYASSRRASAPCSSVSKAKAEGTETCKLQHDRLSTKDRISAIFSHVLIRLLPNTFTASGEDDAIA